MPKRILIAGGGTRGHLFPGIAIAEAFMARDPGNRILFVGTGRPLEISVLSERGFPHETITAEGIKRVGLWNQTLSILKIPKGICESIRILRRFRPDMVIGVGGYSAGPMVIAAWLLGIKILLQEQNIVPGITNRVLSWFAHRIYVSFPDSTSEFRHPEKVRVTGNPVRREIRECIWNGTTSGTDTGIGTGQPETKKPFTVLIIGGSQGARAVNQALMNALPYIKDKGRFIFIHQSRAEDETEVRAAYAHQGIACVVRPFFNDMAKLYQHADMVICRAGATTVAEITAMGKPAIFIPYPYAADNHQVLNARTLADADAAEMILQDDLRPEILAEKIEHYAENPERLEIMASCAKKLDRPNAAELIVNDAIEQMALCTGQKK